MAVGGGVLLSTLLKIGFDRPRPDLVPHGAVVYTASPSGHAMLFAVVYLTLGALLARVQPRRLLKLYLLGLAFLLTVAVGISRVCPALADGRRRRLGCRRRVGAALLGRRARLQRQGRSSPTIPTRRCGACNRRRLTRVRERDKPWPMPYQGGAEATGENAALPR